MSKENRVFDLEDRLIDFAVIHENDELISIFATSIKTAKQKDKNFIIRHSLFDIRCSIAFE